MRKFEKSRPELLKEIHKFVSNVLMETKETRHGELQQKKEYRHLTLIRRLLEEWINEIKTIERIEIKNQQLHSKE